MAAQTGVRGLSTDELQAIRDGLAAGRKPRVMFTEAAGQIAGQVGQVVALTDPAESEEWVVVKFGRDELPFAPTDLQIAPKGPVKKAAPAPPPVPPARAEPEFVLDSPPPHADRNAGAASAAKPSEAAQAGTESGGQTGDVGRSTSAPAPRKAASKPAKPKSLPGLTVTLAYSDGEWTVAANQGSKALAKPYVVRPSEAMKMVALVDVPGVQEAVEQIVSVERAEAEQQAERLRAELAEIEARLQELRDAS